MLKLCGAERKRGGDMLDVGGDSYVTLAWADAYVMENYTSADERRLGWEALAAVDKEVFLRRAARVLDSLPYPGMRSAKGQAMAFPRGDFGGVPIDIMRAQAEEALEYACPSIDTMQHAARTGWVKSKTLDAYSVTYADNSASLLEMTVVSTKARKALRRLMGGCFGIR